jgi:hypothetical protein
MRKPVPIALVCSSVTLIEASAQLAKPYDALQRLMHELPRLCCLPTSLIGDHRILLLAYYITDLLEDGTQLMRCSDGAEGLSICWALQA